MRRRLRTFGVVILAIIALWMVPGCASRKPPVVEPLRDLPDRVPVVFLPGITGTQLADRFTGRILWGNTRSFFFPLDGGYSNAVPIRGDEAQTVPAGPIWKVNLMGVYRRRVYASVSDVLVANGYRLGDIRAPDPEDTLFFLPYDWRRSTVEGAAELARRLEDLRRARGDEVLRVHLICQSNAVQVARYYLRYGGEPLERAETGEAGPPAGVVVEKLLLVAPAAGGSIRTLREMNTGRQYVWLIGRKLRPELFFTFEVLYEALPSYRDDLFIDETGAPLDVDLFDAESWRRYGWSIFGRKAARRANRPEWARLFGDEDERLRFLARSLDRARRLQAVLEAEFDGFTPPPTYVIQNVQDQTAERAMLRRRKDGEWETRFPDQNPIKSDPHLTNASTAPGDGHATAESQLHLTPGEIEAIAAPVAHVQDTHFGLILNPEGQRWLLTFLLD